MNKNTHASINLKQFLSVAKIIEVVKAEKEKQTCKKETLLHWNMKQIFLFVFGVLVIAQISLGSKYTISKHDEHYELKDDSDYYCFFYKLHCFAITLKEVKLNFVWRIIFSIYYSCIRKAKVILKSENVTKLESTLMVNIGQGTKHYTHKLWYIKNWTTWMCNHKH